MSDRPTPVELTITQKLSFAQK